jgi:hypothetical protein
VSTDTRNPIRSGLDLVPGGLALVAMRLLLLLLASLPAVVMLLAGLAGGPARQPYFTEVSGRLPLFHLLRLGSDLSGVLVGGLVLAVVLALLGEQVLVAGALSWLGRGPGEGAAKSPWRAVPARGIGLLWLMLKVVLLAVVCFGVGTALINRLFDALDHHGELAGWTGYTMMIFLPALRVICVVVWLAIVGAWAFWCRVLLVADGRRTVRSTWLLVLRVWRRHPLRAPLFYVVVTLASQLGAGVVLATWRQGPPGSASGVAPWLVSWLLVLALQGYLWYWLLHAARLLYALPDLDPVRERPDGPIGLRRALAWAKRMIRRDK